MPTPDLQKRFEEQEITKEQKIDMREIRRACYRAGLFIEEAVPDGREKSIAIIKLEEAMFWANKGIARQGG